MHVLVSETSAAQCRKIHASEEEDACKCEVR
jgi:hypothetical protein